MFIYRNELRELLDAVRAGSSAHLVAPRGMGATTVLDRVVASLESEGFVVLRFDGRPYQNFLEQSSLQAAGFGSLGRGGQRHLGALIDAVADQLVGAMPRAVVIDRVEAMDAVSLAVVQAAAQRTRTPLVVSRSCDFLALRRSGVNLTLLEGTRVQLRALDFAGTARLVQDRLGQQPSSEILSRVFARSCGIPGLVVAVVDGAVAAHRIALVEGRWLMAARDLWSPVIEGWLESRMADMTALQVEALQHLALAHETPRSEPCTHLPSEMLCELEGLGVLQVATRNGSISYLLDPPALASYFRIHAGGLLRTAASIDGNPDNADGVESTPDRLAQSVQTHRAAVERRIEDERRLWAADPSVATAIAYLKSLLAVPRNHRLARQVLQETPVSSARSAEEAFDLLYLRLAWHGLSGAGVGATADEATGFDVVDAFLELYPAWEEAVALLTSLLTGDMVTSRRAVADTGEGPIVGLPGEALAVAARMFADLVASRDVSVVPSIAPASPSALLAAQRLTCLVDSLTGFATGDVHGALAASRAELRRAREDDDHHRILLSTYVGMLSLLDLGRWREASQIIDQALAFGAPGPLDVALYRAILYCGAFVNASSGERRLAELLAREADSFPVRDEALPWMQRAWGEVIRAMVEGRTSDGGELILGLALTLSSHGALFAALVTAGMALATWPDATGVDLLEEVAERAGRPLATTFVGFLHAALDEGASSPDLSPDCVPAKHLPLAALLLRARRRQVNDRPELSDDAISAALLRIQELLHEDPALLVPSRWADSTATASLDALSHRELEVVRLARSQPNASVAARLGVSVRTVESHIHNVFKKLGVTTRQELFDALDD
ncbi:Bacterial regulatory protein, luxR family [Clavibacter michiganensis]|nr:Bacterial regulatory protein, luxR family [Clavibacter michiganensis]